MTELIRQPTIRGGEETLLSASPIDLLIALEEVLAQLDRLQLHLAAVHIQMALDTLSRKH